MSELILLPQGELGKEAVLSRGFLLFFYSYLGLTLLIFFLLSFS